MNIIACPNCKGSKNTKVDTSHFKCEYCGTIFEIDNHKSEASESVHNESQPKPQAPQVVYVQAPAAPAPQPQIIIEKKSGNGCLGAASVILIVFGIFLCIIGGSNFGIPSIIFGVIFGVVSRPINKNNPL